MHLTMVSSLDSHCRAEAVKLVGRGHRDSVLVLHDLLPDSRVLRRVHFRDRTIDRQEKLLEHGCLACTVRLDVVPTVREFARAGCPHLVLGLPPGVAAGQVLEELRINGPEDLVIDNLLVAVDPSELEDQIWDPRTLHDAGFTPMASDDRVSGEFLVGEFALGDTVLTVPGLSTSLAADLPTDLATDLDASAAPPGAGTPWSQGARLLGHLAPHATVLSAGDDFRPGCHDRAQALSRSRPGAVLALREQDEAEGQATFRTVVHRLARPLHPLRLHQKLPELAQGAHWLRGTLRLASSGYRSVALQGVGPRVWMELAERPVPGARPEAFATRWGGGPLTAEAAVVAVTGRAEDVDPAEVARLLDSCQLSDAELALNPARFPDPFGLPEREQSAWPGL
ncbi:GTP-binding protein [Arthrobacter woluwensis]|uniref:GTP-binding protein n=1 Tax=Arthrobacter woluwensis TaxID=156980 RepID=UPI0011A92117|nr:GTP-binding protein [Arthrobacter woluwensis]